MVGGNADGTAAEPVLLVRLHEGPSDAPLSLVAVKYVVADSRPNTLPRASSSTSSKSAYWLMDSTLLWPDTCKYNII